MTIIYQLRNELKIKLQNIFTQRVKNKNIKDFYVNKKEIRYVYLWMNIWFEENGKWNEYKRPVLVLKKIWNMFLVTPLTSIPKNNIFHHIIDNKQINYDIGAAKTDHSGVILSQIKTIDKVRFIHKIAEITEVEYDIIQKKLKILLF